MIFASIGVFPLIIVSPIDTDMHHLLLGRGGVFFGGQFFLDTLLWQRTNKGVLRSFLGSVLRTHCHGKIVLLVQEAVQVTNTNDRPDLSSEGAPDINKTVTVKQ
jgi:hypothetical protein